jgi:hypothetical protein
MKQKLSKLKTRVKERLEADSMFSGTYRGKVMIILDSVIKEVFGDEI